MFKPHEIHDERDRLEIDHKLYLQSPELQLNDLLHEAAFKGGLSRSLSVSSDMLKKLSHRQMYTFHSHYYTPDRISLVGTGCNHQTLVQLADKFRFSPLDCVYTPGFGNLKLIDSEPEPSKYKGGELRHDTQSSLVHIALAYEGVSSKDENGVLTSSLLNEVLGKGPNIKWSAGSNRLQHAAQAVADAPCLVASFNLHYTESGLFGVHIMCDKNDANKVVKAVWNEFNKVLKNGISKDEFNVAKKKLQVNLQMTAEQSSDVFSKMLSQPDVSDRLTDFQSIVGQLDQGEYSNDSINQLAKKMLTGKPPTLVSIGNLKTMPYIDDLRA
jgi:predicted Zn-dependent peptidase